MEEVDQQGQQEVQVAAVGMAGGFGTRTNGGGAGGSGWVFTEENYNNDYTSGTYTGGEWLLGEEYYLDETAYTIAGDQEMPTYDGTGTMIGNNGDGHSKITLISMFSVAEGNIELTLNGEEEVTLFVGEEYIEQGVTVIKNGEDITNKAEIRIIGTVNTDNEGEYIVTYLYYDIDIEETYAVSRKIIVEVKEIDPEGFEYKEEFEEYIVPRTGLYKLEVWGAAGGNNSAANTGGKGGYSTGVVKLTAGEKLYIYVGGMGGSTTSTLSPGGFNGGGTGGNYSSSYYTGGGGGASDIRIGSNSLYGRVIVAGGGRRFWLKPRN